MARGLYSGTGPHRLSQAGFAEFATNRRVADLMDERRERTRLQLMLLL